MTAADTPASEEPQAPTTQQTSTIGNSRRRSSTKSDLAGSRRSS
eukprot:CAMPEP_0113404128 /NCGR_PEP_ID=MMETSP0013_2-20120614/18214_1 /TAXON_ID=2843 ORGANISM="Skeletonema costatum, Strain 1716" /NCGR_SAMPLE_ID=MMETSP0013_2 /ASSEMBLY_ACC=CAM_ASM_000158 /LENGTH=43 /DNA_ID=CAMNT_0000289689 /DNA_START=94 /DNA_END=221 /DNA_ORIENTATION=+ /assembly_acc=CAM_ASM_000158